MCSVYVIHSHILMNIVQATDVRYSYYDRGCNEERLSCLCIFGVGSQRLAWTCAGKGYCPSCHFNFL